ncbi:MAG: VTT domain-containing protein [Candidatus Methanomethylicaceae archaeon]
MPYLVPIFIMAYILDPFIVGICIGVGATIGKCVSYLIGRGGRALLSEEKKKEFELFGKFLGKYGIIIVYLFASLPLPDDIIVVPFGMAKYDFKKFFIALLAGKLSLGFIVAYVAKYSFEYVKMFVGKEDPILVTIISIALMILMIIIVYKINWTEAIEYTEKYGLMAYIKLLWIRNKDKLKFKKL